MDMDIQADPVLVALLERATGEALDGDAREREPFWETVQQAVAAVPVDEVLAVGVTFCRAEAPPLRATGAALLAQLCDAEAGVLDEAYAVLVQLLERERVPDVIRIALHGISLSRLATAIPAVLPLASHADPGVRLDVTHALTACAGEPASPQAIDALIRLSADPDDAVRDWATFGLGSGLDADDDALRTALAARLADAFLDVREEAAVGLARRGDVRAFASVLALLEAHEVSAQTVEAAGHLADGRLLPPLLELGEWWEDDSDVLRLAIARCDPVARGRFDERVQATIAALELDGVSVEQAGDLTTVLRVGDRSWVLEDLFAHPDVRDDPSRAAARVRAALD
jgi:HEAT repeat protein